MDRKYIDSVVKELFSEMARGDVRINASDCGVWQYSTNMDTQIEGQNNKLVSDSVVLNIPNYNLFLDKIGKYLDVAEKFYEQDKSYFMIDGKQYSKRLILDIFLNATNYDLYDIYNHIDHRRKMLENPINEKEFEIGTLDVVGQQLSIGAKIKRLKFNMEAPYAFEISFSNGSERFVLPYVLFGVVDDTVEVVAIQNLRKGQNSTLKKKLDRYFRKIDDGIVEKGSSQIPNEERPIEEQVTINAVVSLAIFVGLFKEKGIKKFAAPDFTPLRYSTKLNQKINIERINNPEQNVEEIKQNVQDEMNFNQYNMTDKLLNTFMRLALHFDNLSVNYVQDMNKILMDVVSDEYIKTNNLIQKIVEAAESTKEIQK